MRKTLFEKNLAVIKEKLINFKTVYSDNDLKLILKVLKDEELVSKNLSSIAFFQKLKDEFALTTYSVQSDKIRKERYSIKKIGIFNIVEAFEKNSFFSMSTSLNIQGLSDIKNNIIFYSKELSIKPGHDYIDYDLTQEKIDNAYSKPYRKTKNIAKYKDKHLVYLTPKNTNQVGVILYDGYKVSSVNRVLIEMIVNVQYFKSFNDVIEIFIPLKKQLDPKKINKILKKMNFIYPYLQLLGYALEEIGFNRNELIDFNKNKSEFVFYTNKNSKVYDYSEYWNIRY